MSSSGNKAILGDIASRTDEWLASEQAKLVLMSMPDMMFILDGQGRYVNYHAGRTEDLYVPPEVFLGKRVEEVLPARIGGLFQEAYQRALGSEEVQFVEYGLPLRGEIIWFEARFVGMKDDHVLVIVRNIHEAHQIKTRFEENEARFRALVSNVPGAIYRMRCDAHWTTAYISDAIEAITGYAASEFISSNIRSFASVIHPEDRVRVAREVQEALAQDVPFELEYRILHATGSIRWVTDRGQRVPFEDESERLVDGVILDTTEWRSVQQKLLVNRQMASVGALAAGVAHEINNPLAIIMANLEYALEELNELGLSFTQEPQLEEAVGDVRMAVGKIGDSVDRVRRIVGDLRSFSDAAEQHAARVNVERVLEWAIQRLEELPTLEAKVERVFETVPSLWANELGLLQVFSHLLANAAHALTGRGEGSIEVRLFEDKERGAIVVEVIDTGSGMSEETMDHMFEPFFTTKGVGGGTGLGLFVSRGIVQGLGGEIEVESALDEGSTFRVLLPV